MENYRYLLIIFLILLSAVFSGLTIGMFTLDVSDLERKAKNGNPKAKKVLQIRRNGNLLLCTLLIGNSLVNSALSQSIGDEFSGAAALIVSTAVIFLFGELLPQAAFSRHALDVGSKFSWLVTAVMYVLWPVTKPLSFLLDKIFGKDISKLYDREELKDFIDFHEKEGEVIDADERRIMIGAMTFSEKKASDIMTPASVVKMICGDDDCRLYADAAQIRDMFSRIPVWEGRTDNIVSILHVKDLYGATGKISSVASGKAIKVMEDMNLDQILHTMSKNKTHMVCVYNGFGTFLGVVTMEDIIEEIMKMEILDETDDVADMRTLAVPPQDILASEPEQ